MTERCTCGAQPPDDARFCHKCGRPLYDYVPADVEEVPPPVTAAVAAVPPPLVSFQNGTAIRTGLLTSALIIVFNLVPLPGVLGVVWGSFVLVGAGSFAVWRWMRRTHQRPSVADGARLGWMAGMFTFLIGAFFLTFVMLVVSSPELMTTVRQQATPDMKATLDALQKLGPSGLLGEMAVMFVILTILPALGGALSARLLRNQNHQEGV